MALIAILIVPKLNSTSPFFSLPPLSLRSLVSQIGPQLQLKSLTGIFAS